MRIDVRKIDCSRGLTMSELAGLIQANNMNIPAGDLTVEDLRFSVRMTGEQKSNGLSQRFLDEITLKRNGSPRDLMIFISI